MANRLAAAAQSTARMTGRTRRSWEVLLPRPHPTHARRKWNAASAIRPAACLVAASEQQWQNVPEKIGQGRQECRDIRKAGCVEHTVNARRLRARLDESHLIEN